MAESAPFRRKGATNAEVTIQRLSNSQIRDTRWTPVALPGEDHVLALRLRQRAFSRASACPRHDWSKNFEPSEDAVAIKPQQGRSHRQLMR